MYSGKLSVFCFALSMAALGCEPLAIPQQQLQAQGDGGAEGGTGGTSASMIPPGAVSVESTFAGDPGFFAWTTLENGQVREFSFSIPVPTIERAGNIQVIEFLKLPQPIIDQTIFKSLSLMFLPTGHVPAGVYDLPHWEWHIHTIAQSEVETINCSDTTVPSKEQLPPNHICLPACVEKLGMHAYNLNAPEFQGQRFSQGVYGAYYKANFFAIEPKISTSRLLERGTFTMPSYDPAPLGPPGLYPKEFVVKYSPEGHAMVLSVKEWVRK